ncbi:MAG: hypothetical protein H7144_12805 [Burkholderiales bacterium]|nr:hypothetical protein [Phycisphaerae bacterium]
MDQHPPQRRLSEISHLFLSEVRAKQTGNAPRPVRRPPGSFNGDASIDLTPEEFVHVFDDSDTNSAPRKQYKPVRVVVAHHLGESMGQRVRELAGMLCQDGSRIGIIYADAGEVRVCCVEHNPHNGPVADDFLTEPLEAQRIEQSLTELDQDVDEWLLLLPDSHCVESRAILRSVGSWLLITGVEHDAVVESYRTLKGLCDGYLPDLSIAVAGAADEDELRKTHQKLAGVCQQFLKLKARPFGAIEASANLAEHVVLQASSSFNKAQLAAAPQWQVIRGRVAGAAEPIPRQMKKPAPVAPAIAKPTMTPSMTTAPESFPQSDSAAHVPVATAADGYSNIIDLPDADGAPTAIIQAVMRGSNELVESPIKSPAAPDAVIAVSRDHRLVMLANPRQGFTDMRAIANAYRWLNENRALIAMALPQFSIDVHALPRLELLVNHADMTADILQPLLASNNVVVRAYRKLRWGTKTGLLLEAA